jgi:GntR family transcriptional regulator
MLNPQKKIEFNSWKPYYIQFLEIIKESIHDGALKAGQQLPSEPELCHIYGVSRTVIRQTLQELEYEGLIVRKKGKGTFIASPKINESFVQKLTGFYQDMVDRGYKVYTQILKHEVIPASEKVAGSLNLTVDAPVYHIDRLRFINDEPVVLVTTYLPYDKCPGLEKFDLSNQSLYALLEREYGLVLFHGRRTIEAALANKREAQLMNMNEGDPMIILDSVTCLEDGSPIEYYHAFHRGDRSRFEVDLFRVKGPTELQEAIRSQTTDLPTSN